VFPCFVLLESTTDPVRNGKSTDRVKNRVDRRDRKLFCVVPRPFVTSSDSAKFAKNNTNINSHPDQIRNCIARPTAYALAYTYICFSTRAFRVLVRPYLFFELFRISRRRR